MALPHGATSFQEQLQGPEADPCIQVPAGPKSRLRIPYSLFSPRPSILSNVCLACAETSSARATLPCIRHLAASHAFGHQVWLTEHATCSVPSAQKNPSSPSFPRGGYNGYTTRATRSSGALAVELLNGRLNT
ncbi:hypothetical protein Taro_048214 [Colocasia esculenta]|uniref:Uncharacterized protein n=1 Tax=Colocasia esculenta TaxID=4460 RepID=A0A843WV69_COLES|nr:hypothetical protein [Colocasia esculenta]